MPDGDATGRCFSSCFHLCSGTSKMLNMNPLRRLVVLLLLLAVAAAADRKSSSLQFLVVKDENGKPVRNAEIVLHPVDKHGHQKSEGLELKTHEDGKASVSGVPYGKLRIQVIAPGFKT